MPPELRRIADVRGQIPGADVKVTGGQRIDLLGIKKEDLPRVWADLGMKSGYAYGKSLRTVKTCVGTEFCRFGTQNSTQMGIDLETMLANMWSPHKVKLAVSGCPRNCAEAGIKDVGVIAVDSGWELYVGGNGGIKTEVAQFLVKVKSADEVKEYSGAFLQLYREEAYYLGPHRALHCPRRARLRQTESGGRRGESPGVCSSGCCIRSKDCPTRGKHASKARSNANTFRSRSKPDERRRQHGPEATPSWTRICTVSDIPRLGSRGARTGRRQHRDFPDRRRHRIRAARSLPAQRRRAVAGHRAWRERDLSAACVEYRSGERRRPRARRRVRTPLSGARRRRWRGFSVPRPERGNGDLMKTVTAPPAANCGVGCGVLIDAEDGRITGVQGDPDHPANFGKLCSKGMSLALSAQGTTGRALFPELRASGTRRVAGGLAGRARHGRATLRRYRRAARPDAVRVLRLRPVADRGLLRLQQARQGLLGTNNIDTNSRLCMSSAVTAYKLALGARTARPTCYDDLDHAQTVLFAGSNMAWAHPVLFRRLEAAKAANPSIRWIVVDPRRTDTAAMADLHLAIEPGTDVALFNGMLHHLIWEDLIDRDFIRQHTRDFEALKALVRDFTPGMAAELCGIRERDLMQAAEWFGASAAALSLYCMGLNQSSHGTDKNLALINLHLATRQIGRPGAGPFSLTGQPNAMGLAARSAGWRPCWPRIGEIGNPAHRAEVEKLWGVTKLLDRPGLPAVDMFEAVRSGKIKAIWIACTNPVHSMPDIARVREALSNAEFVVRPGCLPPDRYRAVRRCRAARRDVGRKIRHRDEFRTAHFARARRHRRRPGAAKPDWWIVDEVAKRIEQRLPAASRLFGFARPKRSSTSTARSRKAATSISAASTTRCWIAPARSNGRFPQGAQQGLMRRYTDGIFATQDGRARFHATHYLPVAEAASARYPFRLLTGRSARSMARHVAARGRVAKLFSHAPEPVLNMNASDAGRRGFREGDLVRVSSRRGELVLPLQNIRGGPVPAPSLLRCTGTGSFSTAAESTKRFRRSSIRVRRNPSSNIRRCASSRPVCRGACSPRAAATCWRCMAGCNRLLKECGYASVTLDADDRVVVQAAADAAPAGWLERLYAALDLPTGENALEYRDARRGLDKRVVWRENVIDGFVLAGDTAGAGALLTRLREAAPWSGPRLAVFAAQRDPAQARDRVICSCMQVSASRIDAAIAGGATVRELKATLGCGTVCGSCVPELQRMCDAGGRRGRGLNGLNPPGK